MIPASFATAWLLAVYLPQMKPPGVSADDDVWGARGFWSSDTGLAALSAAVIAAVIGAVGATVGTWFVARRVGASLLTASERHAWARHRLEQQNVRQDNQRLLLSERYLGLATELRATGETLRDVAVEVFWSKADPVPEPLIERVASLQWSASLVFQSVRSLLPQGVLRSALESPAMVRLFKELTNRQDIRKSLLDVAPGSDVLPVEKHQLHEGAKNAVDYCLAWADELTILSFDILDSDVAVTVRTGRLRTLLAAEEATSTRITTEDGEATSAEAAQ
ncbi:MAG: hypothetical protein QG671_2288 [Actinomycetota bacterium]|nr:hypothetical protein [Actinomycetota bacterium]